MGLSGKKHSIGKTIATLRKEKGWTQVELAEKLQVSDKAVSKWEKDDSSPSVEFFPALAELFGVSIDYLMTGKTPEKEIITMSTIELCAKKDDPTLLDNFSVRTTDESGRSLMDYIKKYDSLKVLKALFDKCSHQTHYMGLFGWDRGKGIAPTDYLMLIKINGERKYMKEVCRSEEYIYSVSDIEKSGYMPIIQYLIAHYQELPENQKEYYFGKEAVLKPSAAWINAYPYFLQEAYAQDKQEAFDELLKKIVATNSDYQTENEKLRKEMGSYYSSHFSHWAQSHIYIRVLRSTVELAYQRGDIALGDQLNSICETPLSNYDKKVIAIDNDKTLSAKEKRFQRIIHDGVVCIDELLETKDFKLIKETIKKYPIHPIEHIANMLQAKQSRELFRYAVDNNLGQLASCVANGYKLPDEYIEAEAKYLVDYYVDGEILQQYWYNHPAVINKKYFSVSPNQQSWNIPQVLRYISQCKEKIINDLSLRLDKEKTIGDLTREYFEKELAKGNIEMVIIKLCVRLEAILRCDYQYEGDFSDMLNRFCSYFNTTDDEGNDYDPYTPKILNKLRMQRNGIVHSEKCTEELSVDEIKFCIDYICKMG